MSTKETASRKKPILILLLAAAAALVIAGVIYCIGPQCSFKEKISTYTTRQCPNRTGIGHAAYCQDHMYIKEVPADLEKAFSSWDFDLMKDAIARAKAHDMNIKYELNNLVKEYGASRCNFTNCPLYTPGKHELYCQDHAFANEAMDAFCAALIRCDTKETERIHKDCISKGWHLHMSDPPIRQALSTMISQSSADATDILLQLRQFAVLFRSEFLRLEAEDFSKLKELVKTQGTDLKTMDPNQGYYAGQKNSSGQHNNGLLATKSQRTYGYNYEVFSRSSSAAAINNGGVIDSTRTVDYKGITVAESLGAGIWAIETPDYDFVLVGSRICIIDNKLGELDVKIEADH